jgi:hypothetical protein
MKLADRIDEALKGGPMSFYDLAVKLYPSRDSHRCSSNGGPPGCYMTLSAAIRRGGFFEKWLQPGPGHRIVYPRRGVTGGT